MKCLARVLLRHLAFWGFLILILGVVGGFFLHLQVSGNLYPLIEGQYFRSAQLDPARLETVIANQGIRSILNLRGAQPGEAWYDAEVALAERLHVAHYDVGLSGRHAVPVEKIESILALLRQAPKPVLIHCQAGADRTGLVAAVLRLEQGDPPSQARRQLGWRYGHFPWLGNATMAMDQSFDAYLSAKTHREIDR